MTLLRANSAHVPAAAMMLLVLVSTHLQAQTAPTGGELLREAEKSAPRPVVPVLPEPERPAPPAVVQGPTVEVKAFKIEGSQRLDEDALQQVLRPWVGTRANLASLRQAADAVAQLYREQGYLARAWLPEQEIRDGLVRIRVVEGRLTDVRIERQDAERALPDATIRALLLARQEQGQPVRTDDLQRAVTILNETPGMRAASVLEPGTTEGDTRIILAVTGAPLVTGNVQLDNAGSRATGETRATLNLSFNGPLAAGDQWQLSGNLTEHSSYARLGGSLPVGADGVRLSAAVSALEYSYDLNAVDYSGHVATTSFGISWPMVRRSTQNLTWAATAEQKSFRNLVAGASLSDKSVSKLSLAVNADQQDAWGGGGVLMGSLQLDHGQLDLSGNAADLANDQIAGGPGRDGRFTKLTATLTRLQRLSATQTLTLTALAQRSSGNLDSSEKFQLTGPYGVRAYSVSEPSVDKGVLLDIDWRVQVAKGWFLGVFHDEAVGWRDARENLATSQPNKLILRGTGLSVSWDAPGEIQVKTSVAWRDTANPARNLTTNMDADGTHKHMRVLFSITKAF